MDMLKWGLDYLNANAVDTTILGTASATYSRVNANTTLSITLLRNSRVSLENQTYAVNHIDQDVRILVADLKLATVLVRPKNGDRIVYSLDGVTNITLEVQPLSDLEPCWRYVDQTRTAYRIHTKEILRV